MRRDESFDDGVLELLANFKFQEKDSCRGAGRILQMPAHVCELKCNVMDALRRICADINKKWNEIERIPILISEVLGLGRRLSAT